MANVKLDYRQTPLEVNGLLIASESVITDGQWHHVGLVYDFDGLHRCLYVDGAEGRREYRIFTARCPVENKECRIVKLGAACRGLHPALTSADFHRRSDDG